MRCWLCDCEITDKNDAKEHIIPDAIGGRKTIRGFICEACNSETGRSWDAVVARQLQGAGLLFGIARQKGTPVPPIKVFSARGESFVLQSDNKLVDAPFYEEVRAADGSIRIHMKDMTPERLQKRVDGLKRKYPRGGVEGWKIDEGKRFSKTPVGIDWTHGGSDFDRSLIKSALALACSVGIEIDNCRLAVDYLRDDQADYDASLYLPCYGDDLVRNRPRGFPIHCVHVTGDPDSRTLLAYVELYGAIRRIVLLSDAYEGKRTVATYVVNPIAGEAMPVVAVDLDYSKFSTIVAAQTYDVVHEGMRKAFHEVLSYREQLNLRRAFDEHLDESLDECQSELGLSSSNEWSDEEKRSFSECIAGKMMPLLEHWAKPLDFPKGFDPSQPDGRPVNKKK